MVTLFKCSFLQNCFNYSNGNLRFFLFHHISLVPPQHHIKNLCLFAYCLSSQVHFTKAERGILERGTPLIFLKLIVFNKAHSRVFPILSVRRKPPPVYSCYCFASSWSQALYTGGRVDELP